MKKHLLVIFYLLLIGVSGCVLSGTSSLKTCEDSDNLELGYVLCNNKIYYTYEPFGKYASGPVSIEIKGVDTETFEDVKFKYARDKNNVYFEGKIIPNADPETFETIGLGSYKLDEYSSTDVSYSKDKNSVYYLYEIVDGADPETFEIKAFPNPQNSPYVMLYGVDKGSVYFFSRNKKIDNADPETFEYLGNNYAHDKNNVFYIDNVVLDADPKTFEVIGCSGGGYARDYAKDKNNVYHSGIKKPELDSKDIKC